MWGECNETWKKRPSSLSENSSCIIINDKEQELIHLRMQNWNVFCKYLLGKWLKLFSIIKMVKLIFFTFNQLINQCTNCCSSKTYFRWLDLMGECKFHALVQDTKHLSALSRVAGAESCWQRLQWYKWYFQFEYVWLGDYLWLRNCYNKKK